MRGREIAAAVVVGLLLIIEAGAQTEIHKCTAADGSVIYSQLPCEAGEAREVNTVDETDGVSDKQETASAPDDTVRTRTAEFVVTVPLAREPDENCQKKYRDAIDEIDAEMRREYTPEKSEQYKESLLALTARLREC